MLLIGLLTTDIRSDLIARTSPMEQVAAEDPVNISDDEDDAWSRLTAPRPTHDPNQICGRPCLFCRGTRPGE